MITRYYFYTGEAKVWGEKRAINGILSVKSWFQNPAIAHKHLFDRFDQLILIDFKRIK